MATLRDIPGLDEEMIRVLQGVGIETPEEFALMPVDLVCRALSEGLPAGRQAPGVAQVAGLQDLVRGRVVPGPQSAPVPQAVAKLPVAEALSSKQLMESGIVASEVPVARILGNPGDADLSLPPREKPAQAAPPPEPRPMPRPQPVAQPQPQPQPQPQSRTEQRPKGPAVVVERVPLGKPPETEEAPLGEMQFVSTDERSREERDFARKNRGMTHKDPGRVMRGALALLLANLLAAVGFGTIIVALSYEYIVKSQVPAHLAWGLLGFPAALLVFLLVATPPRCRLCGQRLFVPRQCRKHERAHRSILGYSTALALHVVCFRWFRCSLCGTKQKLK